MNQEKSKVDFKARSTVRDKEGCFIVIKLSVQ